ncbi:MAG: YihY/virulence factor BrkB family protein [Anaerolineae bacterium]|nr:YihY/virulence factor BrkB family protein [Anaerolineae bacterium]
MKPFKRSKVLASLWQKSKALASHLNERSNGWLWILANSVQKTLMPETSIMASAIAYISLFSLFPLILLSISLASFGFSAYINQQAMIKSLEFVAPALEQLLGQNIEEVIRARGHVTSVALLSLLWSASTIFYMLTHTLNRIWRIKQRRSSWKARGVAILFVLGFVGPTLFLISLTGSVITNIRFWLPDLVIPLGYGLSLLLTLLLDVALFMVLYIILPHGSASWREVLPGAVGAGLLWELAKRTFLYFVSTYISITNLVYGTLTTIIAFLLWAYIGSLIFIFGAYLSVSYQKVRLAQSADLSSLPIQHHQSGKTDKDPGNVDP